MPGGGKVVAHDLGQDPCRCPDVACQHRRTVAINLTLISSTANLDREHQRSNAGAAAVTFRYATEAWLGDRDVVGWPNASADLIDTIGMFDKKRWP